MGVLQQEIEKGVKILRKGGVIAFPTDTVYGLGADAFNPTAVERIYEIKDRPKHRQLPLLIADVERLATLAEPIPEIAWFLARQFWPGGLTLVLPKTDSLPAYLASGSTIAVRVPNHPVCLALIQHLGNPIIGTSANISGQPAALTAEEVGQQLGGKIDFIINGGKCPGGKESTVVDITRESPIILRQGIIPSDEIDKAYKDYSEVNSEAHCYRL
ncbi:MAG: threonylcarbamoyl-AMP synthase [Dehalococcoidia bacterium]|nr:MAG: threonylcarbamoyl-AMP synthase [Dehalococcoidia bacterium]